MFITEFFEEYKKHQIQVQGIALSYTSYTLYCQTYWVTPSNERFDYFSDFHEYKS